jgi:hypothetical protein
MSFATTLLHFAYPMWVAIVFVALLLPLGPPTLRRLWRRPRRHDPPRGWPWGAPLWRGYTRSLLVCWIAAPLMLTAVVVGRFAPKDSTSPLFWLAVVLTVAAAFALLVLLPGVYLFARPKFLIPPLLRSQPGAVSEWISRWSKRRRSNRGAGGAGASGTGGS